jgi:hypothetical protein
MISASVNRDGIQRGQFLLGVNATLSNEFVQSLASENKLKVTPSSVGKFLLTEEFES